MKRVNTLLKKVLAAGLSFGLSASMALAEDYPSKPIEMVVPVAASRQLPSKEKTPMGIRLLWQPVQHLHSTLCRAKSPIQKMTMITS